MKFKLKVAEKLYTGRQANELGALGFKFRPWVVGNLKTVSNNNDVTIEINIIETLDVLRLQYGKLSIEGDTITIMNEYEFNED